MAAITDVTLTAGVPTAGTGTVTTLDKFNGTAGSSTTQALTVQGIASGTAVPVSVATIPSHAVTNAGTFVVQENGASLTALQLIDDTITAQGTALGTTKTSLHGGSVTTAAPTYTTGQISPLSLDTTGALRVNVTTGGGTGGTSSNFGSAFPTPGTAVGFSDGTNMVAGRVKAASTAPVATDPAIVVAISPNSVNPNAQATMANSSPVVIASDQAWPVSTVGFMKKEDVASADGDAGIPAMAVRKATPANLSGTDGDWEFLQVSAGRVWASTVVEAAAASIGKAEDVASADADVGVPAMAILKATPADTAGTDGDYQMLQMKNGRLWVSDVLEGGTTAHDAAAASINPVLLGGYASAAAPTDVSADNDAVRAWFLRNGSLVATLNGGMVAHDSADANNPIKIGLKATTSLSGLTLVSDADRTNAFAGLDGVQITRPHCNLEDIVSGLLANTDGASTSVIAAQGAGIKTYITTVIIANTSATAVTVDLRDGAAGSVKATFPVPANTSGLVCNFSVPLPFSANTAVCMDGSAAASTVTVTLMGFKSKV